MASVKMNIDKNTAEFIKIIAEIQGKDAPVLINDILKNYVDDNMHSVLSAYKKLQNENKKSIPETETGEKK